MRLPAPMIEGTLPAFYANERGIAKVAIPFSMSRAVSKGDVEGFELKLRSVYGSTIIDLVSGSWDEENGTAIFEIDTNKKGYYVGSFYKAQIAYRNEGDVGYYSPVGVIKFTSKPTIKIDGLTIATNNAHLTQYTGIYSQYQKDATEKVYSYKFIVKDDRDQIIEDTGWQLHNRNSDDSQYESHDTFYFSKAFEDNKKYKIQYSVKTNNNLEVSTPFYSIIVRKSVAPNFKVDIVLSKNDENGYIEILLKRNQENENNNEVVKGSFLLTRSSEKSNFTEWEEISRFNLTSHRSSLKTIKDFAVEQGVKYKYSIQQFNDQGLYSERNYSEEISVDYEHSFLYDGKRQLKIKFNPKMSHFKTDVFEAKVDTIGSKYPFIFRNGNVAYKEFQIGGLISYLIDEESLFFDNSDKYKEIHRIDNQQGRTLIVEKMNLDFYNEVEDNSTIYYKEFKEKYWVKVIDANGKRDFVRWEKWIASENYKIELEEKQDAIEKEEIFIKCKNCYEVNSWKSVMNIFKSLIRKEMLFRTKDEKEWKNYELATNTLEGYNFSYEREFKLEVLDWLNDGKPKLFKSPSEGLYLVRLMNISLTPEESINRLVHNFTATAYEIGESSYKGLDEHGIVDLTFVKDKYYRLTSIPLTTTDYNYYFAHKNLYEEINGIYYAYGNILPSGSVEYFKIEDVQPGTVIGINGENIMIGATGTYESAVDVNSIFIPSGSKLTGQITVGYFSEVVNSFDEIMKTETRDILNQQFFGVHENIIKELNNIERKVAGIYDIKAHKRESKNVYHKEVYTLTSGVQVDNWFNYYSYYETGEEGKMEIRPAHNLVSGREYYQREEYIMLEDLSAEQLSAEGALEQYKDIILYKYIVRPLDNNPIYEDEKDEYVGRIKIYMDYISPKVDYTVSYKMLTDNKFLKEIRFVDIDNNLEDQQVYEEKYKQTTQYGEVPMNYGSGTEERVYEKSKELNWKNRTSTNYPFLSSEDTRGFYSGLTYKDGKTYLSYPIYYYILPEVEVYNEEGKFLEDIFYYVDEECVNESTKYLPYTTKIFFDNNEVDISQTEYFSSGSLDKLNVLKSGAGVYLELYYQSQIVEYSKATLIDYDAEAYEATKEVLDIYDEKLSREYASSLVEENDINKYMDELEEIYNNYNKVYSDYIKFLDRFIKAIEEE